MSSTSVERDFDLPQDYVISKYYEFGYKVNHNSHSKSYNCCCPICREGDSWGRKRRSYYIADTDVIYCHNCGWSSRPYNWIVEVSGMSYDEIRDEVESGDYGILNVLEMDDGVVESVNMPSLPIDSINLFDKNQVDFYKDNKKVQYAMNYLKNRRLDTAINKPDAYYISLKDRTHKNRLIIPFKDDSGKIVFYQSRKVFEWDEKSGYISKNGGNKTLFGFDKVDMELGSVYIFEGPLDATFVKNGIGLGGINKGEVNFTPDQEVQMNSLLSVEKIWMMDNQWMDETAREKTKILIKNKERVFIWPKSLKYKDFNQMCISERIDRVSHDFINDHLYRGLHAEVKMKEFKHF